MRVALSEIQFHLAQILGGTFQQTMADWLALACIIVLAMAWILTLRNRAHEQARILTANIEALRLSEERFSAFVRNVPGIAFIKDREGKYLFANDGFLGLLPKPGMSVLGKTDMDIWPERAAQEQMQHDQELLAAKGRIETTESFGTDDRRQWITTRFGVLNAKQEVKLICGIGIEITERKNLQDQLLQVQKMDCVGRLAGGVAHDFKNILTVINGYTTLLNGEPLTERGAEFSREIQSAACRAAELTKQLLMFSRKQVIKPALLDLNDVCRGMAKMLGRILGEDVTLELKLSERPALAEADRGMLEQIILNLAVNSRDAMPDGGSLAIESGVCILTEGEAAKRPDARAGKFVALRITDTGCGISEEILPKIFEPFFTTKEAGHGTGLGLATVYGIVRQHRGWINVKSQVGAGTTFEIFLAAGEGVGTTAAKAAAEAAAVPAAGGREKVLLVEDDPHLRHLSAQVLSRNGYQVLQAGSGPAALALLRTQAEPPDLVITDVVLPGGLTGIDLKEFLSKEIPGVPVILCSGYNATFSGKTIHLAAEGIFLEKPYSPERLLHIVREHLVAGSGEGQSAAAELCEAVS